MNPVKQIGRYQLPLLSIVAVRRRRGWRLWLTNWLIEKFDLLHEPNVYDVLLSTGHTIRFTQAEKEQYDTDMEWHGLTLQVYGMFKGLGGRG
jgi:hypothetical protein